MPGIRIPYRPWCKCGHLWSAHIHPAVGEDPAPTGCSHLCGCLEFDSDLNGPISADPITTEDLYNLMEEAQALDSTATQGPWWVGDETDPFSSRPQATSVTTNGWVLLHALRHEAFPGHSAEADAHFAARARYWVPRAAQAIRHLIDDQVNLLMKGMKAGQTHSEKDARALRDARNLMQSVVKYHRPGCPKEVIQRAEKWLADNS